MPFVLKGPVRRPRARPTAPDAPGEGEAKVAIPLSADKFLSVLKNARLGVVEHGSWRTHNRDQHGNWGPVNGVMIHHTGAYSSASCASPWPRRARPRPVARGRPLQSARNGFSTHEAGKPWEPARTTEACFSKSNAVMAEFPQVTTLIRQNS